METAVLVHGCHLGAKSWEDIVWGNPRKNRLGRVPKALLEAQKFDAKVVIFSTGASEKEGLKEGEYIYHYSLDRLAELEDLSHRTTTQLRMWLQEVAQLELTSLNTRTEVLASAKLAKAQGVERLILVSSPTHIMRCHQAALSVLDTNPELRFFLANLYAVASDTCYANSVVEDVVIVEPPHRGDRPEAPVHLVAARVNKLGRGPKAAEFVGELGQWLDTWNT